MNRFWCGVSRWVRAENPNTAHPAVVSFNLLGLDFSSKIEKQLCWCGYVYTQNIKEVTWINLFQAKGQTQASGNNETKIGMKWIWFHHCMTLWTCYLLVKFGISIYG